MRNAPSAALMALACLISGCASTDHVLFVTKTSLGIDFDSKPGTAAFAYDRIEGYVAPSYGNGEIPPVVASIESDGKVFEPKIRQLYATGDAARIAVGGKRQETAELPMEGDGKLMFFGTTTTVGLKIGFTTALPDSVTLGYKRKEYSHIPLGEKVSNGKKAHVYPSVLAAIDLSGTARAAETSGLTTLQFFATGEAARLLADDPKVSNVFKSAAREAVLAAQRASVEAEVDLDEQIDALFRAIRTAYNDSRTTAAQKSSVVSAAQTRNIGSGLTTANFTRVLRRFTGDDATAPDERRKRLELLRGDMKTILGR